MRLDSSAVWAGYDGTFKGKVLRGSNENYLGLLKVMNLVELSFEQIGEFLFIGGIPIM